MKLSGAIYVCARELVAGRLGLDFPEARQADLERGLIRTARTSPASDPQTYLTWLATRRDDDPEWRRLAGHLTVGETYFFRDRACFEALEQEVLPSLIAARRSEGILRLRLWSAGCATGEEPYSLAILLDRLLPDRAEWAATILATDINPAGLEAARRGRYREWSFRETPSWIRDRYFHRCTGETFELDPRIRRMVAFAPLNLGAGGYPTVVTNTSAMDLILCRNVLMYFTPEAQRATVARLQTALVAGGWLAVSPAEASVELFRPLAPVNFFGATIYRKEEPSADGRPPTADGRWLPSLQAEAVLPHLQAPAVPIEISGDPVGSPPEEQSEAPPAPPTDLQRARSLANQGKLEDARHLCEAALARDRLDPDAHLLLAAICQERNQIPAALEALRRAIYLAPNFAPAHFLQGTLLLREGKHRQGQRSMETVVSLLSPLPRDEAVPGGDGLTAGRLLETAQMYLELRR